MTDQAPARNEKPLPASAIQAMNRGDEQLASRLVTHLDFRAVPVVALRAAEAERQELGDVARFLRAAHHAAVEVERTQVDADQVKEKPVHACLPGVKSSRLVRCACRRL